MTDIKDLKKASGKDLAKMAPKDQVKALLMQNSAALKNVLPKHVTPDRMMQVALTAFTTTPALQECYVPSLISSVVQASAMGLEPNTVLGHAYLVPFNNKKKRRTDCQLIIGYRGLIDLARRSGEIISLNAHAVYQQDEFSYEYGLEEHLRHIPSEDDDPGELTHVYAIAHLKGGGHVFEVMTKKQVDKIRAGSQSGGSQYSPWSTHYEAMARKTVIRRLAKYLPMSVQLATAVDADEKAERGEVASEFNIFEGEFETQGLEPEHEEEQPPPPKKKSSKKKRAATEAKPDPDAPKQSESAREFFGDEEEEVGPETQPEQVEEGEEANDGFSME